MCSGRFPQGFFLPSHIDVTPNECTATIDSQAIPVNGSSRSTSLNGDFVPVQPLDTFDTTTPRGTCVQSTLQGASDGVFRHLKGIVPLRGSLEHSQAQEVHQDKEGR